MSPFWASGVFLFIYNFGPLPSGPLPIPSPGQLRKWLTGRKAEQGQAEAGIWAVAAAAGHGPGRTLPLLTTSLPDT